MKTKYLLSICSLVMLCIAGIRASSLQAEANEEYTDVTSKVVNPEFDNATLTNGAPAGWVQTAGASTSKISVAAKGDGSVIVDGQNHWQLWHGSGLTGKASQTLVNLPNGKYTVRAGLFASFGGTVSLYANEGSTAVTSNNSAYYEATGTVYDGTLEIGLDLATSGGQTTIEFDHITLRYYGGDLEGYIQTLNEKLAIAAADTLRTAGQPGFIGVPALREAIKQAQTAAQTETALLAAITALDEAVAAHEAILAAYEPLKEAIAGLTGELAASAYPDKSSFEAAIAAAQALYDHPADQRAHIGSTLTTLSGKSEILASYALLEKTLSTAKKLFKSSDYPDKEAFGTALSAAQAVYNNPGGQDLAAAISTLNAAYTQYLQGRPSEWTTLRNGALWKDTHGNSVQAHGAGFLQVGDTWYMIGENRDRTWNPDVNMYSTKDFVTWKFERRIITNSTHSALADGSRFIERPKLMYCAATGKFVVWCHWEQGDYGASEAAVFYCDSVNGPYKFHWAGRPLGIKSRDCNVFVDHDGTAYFISTTNENRDLGLFKLSGDYLSAVSHTVLFAGQGREAPAIVRVDDRYFMISSACTGWDPNQAKISHSTSLTSGWSSLSNLGNGISFDTQAASILTVQGAKGTTYLYVGDRWQDPGLAASKTILFPIQFSGTSCTFKYSQQFDINFPTGEYRETTVANRVPKTNWKIRACSSQETSGENGAAANAIDGNLTTKWHTKYSGGTSAAPHHIEVDMGAEHEVSGFLCTPRTDNSTNGLIREYLFYVSTDGTNWEAVSGGAWMPYYAEVYFKPVRARYFRLVALAGTYASIAELDMLQNTASYTPQTLLPYYKIGSGSWLQSDQIKNVTQGSTLAFGPNISSGSGTWAFQGPNGHQAATREYTLTGVTAADAGIYTSLFVNAYNQSSKRDITVTVKDDPSGLGTVSSELQETARKYYTLQGLEIPCPVASGIYIIEKTYEDGSKKTGKEMIHIPH